MESGCGCGLVDSPRTHSDTIADPSVVRHGGPYASICLVMHSHACRGLACPADGAFPGQWAGAHPSDHTLLNVLLPSAHAGADPTHVSRLAHFSAFPVCGLQNVASCHGFEGTASMAQHANLSKEERN